MLVPTMIALMMLSLFLRIHTRKARRQAIRVERRYDAEMRAIELRRRRRR